MAQTDPFISAEPVSRLPLGHLPWKPALEAPRREATFAGSAPGTEPNAIMLGSHQSARGAGGAGPEPRSQPAASGPFSVLTWQPSTGSRQRDARGQIYLVLISKIHMDMPDRRGW